MYDAAVIPGKPQLGSSFMWWRISPALGRSEMMRSKHGCFGMVARKSASISFGACPSMAASVG